MPSSVDTLVEETTQELIEAEEVDLEARTEEFDENYDDAYDKWIGRPDKDLPLLRLSSTLNYQSEYRPLKASDAMVLIWVGLRGAGKTLGLSYFDSMVMINDRPCWSNVPIAFRAQFPDGKIKAYRSEKMNMELLYKLEGDYTGGAVSISELQYYNDCRRSGSSKNLVLNYDIMQIRKLNLSFYADVKNIGWVDNRTQYETDVIFGCQDVHYTDWGWDNKVGRGEIIHWDAVDISGYWTGHGVEDPQYAMSLIRQHKATGQPSPLIHEFTLPLAKLIWPIYPTGFIVNIMEAMRPVSYSDKINLNNTDAEKKHKTQLMALQGRVNELKHQGLSQISAEELWEEFEIAGDENEKVQKRVAKALNDLRIKKRKVDGVWHYIL